MLSKEIREKRIEEGVCVKCGINRVALNRHSCEQCLEVDAKKSSKYRKKLLVKSRLKQREKLGLCVVCGNPAVDGKKKCEICSENSSLSYKKWRAKNISIGICACCSKDVPLDDKFLCKKCSEKYNFLRKTRRQEKKTKGVCVDCCEKATHGTRCEKHYLLMKNSYLKRKEECLLKGLCIKCRKNKSVGKIQECHTCNLKSMAMRLWKDKNRWHELLELYDRQNGLCVYLNEEITIGNDASIDHILPKSRSGGNDIENLQWVHYDINMMKRNKTHEEFLDLVKRIRGKHEKSLVERQIR